MIQKATTATVRSTLGSVLYVVAGGLIGLALGSVFIVVRFRGDRRLRRLAMARGGLLSRAHRDAAHPPARPVRGARVIASVMPESTLPVSGMIQTGPLPDQHDPCHRQA